MAVRASRSNPHQKKGKKTSIEINPWEGKQKQVAGEVPACRVAVLQPAVRLGKCRHAAVDEDVNRIWKSRGLVARVLRIRRTWAA
ncbi:hypothetical protein EJB05_48621 [Eragrostis curvula]|uniref:Uncharacterized protein n=1 Tax=Eragrostis curvula TaxID=38414 RepID=A0A5J9T259_9POAL|nr:hypothetical protein EJB05_48621 [Eragrostis curvula]